MSILRIRDASGNVQEIPVIKGDKGDRGPKGADGLTPTFEFATMSNDVLDGTQVRILIGGELIDSFFVYNGRTPVKGEDYWTTADKTEIVNDVLSSLPAWTGGSY